MRAPQGFDQLGNVISRTELEEIAGGTARSLALNANV